jgi:hypothetical protein
MAEEGAGAGAAAAAAANDGLLGPNDCGICYADIPVLKEKYELHRVNGVPHIFHRACITSWLATTIQTGAPFFCSVCANADDEVRVSARGLAWAEKLVLILMLREVDWTRIPGLNQEDLDNIPEELWPPMEYRILGGGGAVAVALLSYYVRMRYLSHERLNVLTEAYNHSCVMFGGNPDRRPLDQISAMINGQLAHLYREIPETENQIYEYTIISIGCLLATLIMGIGFALMKSGRLGGGGGKEQKQICINKVCYPIPDGMEPVLSSLIISLKHQLANLNKSQIVKSQTVKGGKHTRKCTRPLVLLSYKPGKRHGLNPKGFKASHKVARPSKK